MKNERGSITLFVLVSMLFFLIIATTAYVSASTKLQGQNDEIARIKASYEQDLSDEALLQLYNKVTKTREWLAGSGTQEDTYKIYTIEDLVEFSRRSNAGEFVEEGTGEARYIYVELMNDLDFKRDSSYAKADRTDFGDVNDDGNVQDLKIELTTGQGFPCIAATETNAFNGTFEGNEHEIKNLYINSNSTRNGLFANINNATVQDLGVSGEITNKNNSTNYGASGIATYSSGNSRIKNCYNKSNIKKIYSNGSVAGIIADTAEGSTTIVENCYNSGSLSMTEGEITTTGTGNVAGLVGCNQGTLILVNSYNTGNIKNDIGTHTAGLVGRDNSITTSIKIINCYNTGEITSRAVTGGMIGLVIGNTTVVNSYNEGDIERFNNSHNGGIIGHSRTGTSVDLNNVFNIGNIDGTHIIDGIIGACMGNSSFINSYYENNNTYNGYGANNPEIITKLEQAQMQASSFVDTLNANKNSINLSDYGLSDYTLSLWKQGEDGYPDFDW